MTLCLLFCFVSLFPPLLFIFIGQDVISSSLPFSLKDSRLLCPGSLCICVPVRLLHLCECVCHRTVSGRWHFSASITIAPSVPLSLQPWRRVMSPVSLKTPTYNACPPQIPTPPYPAQPVHHPLTLTLTSPSSGPHHLPRPTAFVLLPTTSNDSRSFCSLAAFYPNGKPPHTSLTFSVLLPIQCTLT